MPRDYSGKGEMAEETNILVLLEQLLSKLQPALRQHTHYLVFHRTQLRPKPKAPRGLMWLFSSPDYFHEMDSMPFFSSLFF